MIKRLILISLIMLSIILTACSTQNKKTIKTNTPNQKRFNTMKPVENYQPEADQEFQSFDISMLPDRTIPITISPDSKTVYYMEPTDKAEITYGKRDFVKALKGNTHQYVNLMGLNISSGKKNLVAESIPFISYSKWNSTGNMIAFCGGEKLTVYDVQKNKLLFNEELINDNVTYFGWSPDGNSIYTEHSNLINGTLYNIKDNKTLHCYETDIRLYYKGTCTNNRYFATESLNINEYRTVITDDTGKVLKELTGGRFRGSYKSAAIQVGESGFSLQYIGNTYKADIKEMTKEYVYDTKFIAGGYFIYTIKSDDVEKNIFTLCIADDNGNEKLKIPVSGPYISVSPDGRIGYVSGPLNEQLSFDDFLNNKDTQINKQNEKIKELYEPQNDEENLSKTLRAAMNTYLKFYISGIKDYNEAARYFIDSENPSQMGYFDITKMFDERNSFFVEGKFYVTDLYISKLSVKTNRASVVVCGICRNSGGGGSGAEHALELIKKDGEWYVTGFSTFPESQKAKDMKVKVEKIIKDMTDGRLFDGNFKGTDINIGQIQFWQMSEPTLCTKVDYSNYCKVYLKVMRDKKEIIYKMVLSKDTSWNPVGPPTSERFSGLN